MGKKLTDSKTIEKLAILAVAKTGPDDNIAEITKKIISDYFWAKETIKEYNDDLPARKEELKHIGDKRQARKSKAKITTKKKEMAK